MSHEFIIAVSRYPDTEIGTVITLDPGMMLYPTGEKKEIMWEVEDELGNKAGCRRCCSSSRSKR